MNIMVYKPFDYIVDRLGNYLLTNEIYEDGEGFDKNCYAIYEETDSDYISRGNISGFTYNVDIIKLKEVFIKNVQKLHNEKIGKTI